MSPPILFPNWGGINDDEYLKRYGHQLVPIMSSRKRRRAGASPSLRVGVISGTLRTTTGAQTFTLPGGSSFGTPVAAIVIGGNSQGAIQAHLARSFGATDGTNQWCVWDDAEDNSASTDTGRDGRTDEVFVQGNVAGDTAVEANFTAFVDNGITLTVGKTDASPARLIIILIGGNEVSAAAGVASLGALGATVTVEPGLQTNVLIAKNLHTTFAAAIAAAAVSHIGLATYDGTTIRQCCANHTCQDAQLTGDPALTVDDDKLLAANAAAWTVSLGNITDTEFDLTSNGADLSGHQIGYLALNIGSNQAWAGVVDSPAAVGDHDFTEPGFRPVFGLMLPTMLTAVDSDVVDETAGAFGVAAFDGINDWCYTWTDEDAADPSNTSSAVSNKAIDLNADDQSAAFDATFSQWLSNGARLNFTAVPGTARKWPALFLGRP